jgi:hypothetical protein
MGSTKFGVVQQRKILIDSKQLGAIPSVGVSKDLDNATKVVQENQNSKSMAEKMADLIQKNTAVLQEKLHPQQDFKLNMLAQKLCYEHNLSAKSGFNKTTLVYLILENAQRNMDI